MNVSKSNFLKKEYSWGKIGAIIGIISLFLALAFGFYTVFHKNTPNISFEIINEANVLDVHKPLEDLTILFQGEDIQENNKNLRIFTIRIKNSGQIDILQTHYDHDVIWGFQIEDGDIIEWRLLDSNSDYIISNLNPRLIEENIIEFEKIIFEREKFFIFEVLVLHNKDIFPSINAIGKIVGIERIDVIKIWQEEDDFIASERSVLSPILILMAFVTAIMAILTFYLLNIKQGKEREIRFEELIKELEIDRKIREDTINALKAMKVERKKEKK